MSTGAMRRAQLVTPFGVGAMSVLVNGTSVITAGLDHWYEVADQSALAMEEYQEHDWRLESRLKVSEFRLPPDYRPSAQGSDLRNVRLTVPVLRFPRWSFCIYCKRLDLSKLTMKSLVECQDKEHADKKYKPKMSQVPFVAICTRGHLDDFPFDKWVHRSANPSCTGTLRLVSRGGGGLEGQVVTCDICKKERSLRGVTEARLKKNGEEHTNLSDQLVSPDEPYLCGGARPWLAQLDGVCDQPIRGALRAAGNVYFPKVESSIYLPRREGAVSEEVHQLLRHPAVSTTFNNVFQLGLDEVSGGQLRRLLERNVPPELFAPISDEELLAAYQDQFGIGENSGEEPAETPVDAESLTSDDIWRHPEYGKIRETPKDDFLAASDPGLHADLASYLSRVRSVDVLRETRALRGFTRVRDGELKLTEGKAMLRRTSLPPAQDWLPAYVVKGEGIYIELDGARLAAWEGRAEVQARAQRITDHYGSVASQRGLLGRTISPRFVLLHTVSHLLINELIFACGYSSASLRERLYVSESIDRHMFGALIYTAAGDSEGTMGGLVRMARPDNLRQVFASALADAHWCSTDPVCMDAGKNGQGPDSCNLAACHACGLLPETSCEEFNRFLDRGLVVGTLDDPNLGYFSDAFTG
ncbi:DUF1998 domain-containing protein [Chryseoglobus sp. 28M-23]|uniref:DUF1998 domain-containing protein n=1 Tax=Chryseoglobus sp. 28M-23 TaxID=2772253 RepID=UPI001746C9E8|nr:DUF1998 domain-containing protein [Chryseoglobus sp. 28M-23]QOD93531.1 DUF1998 domain-containing protein [Chryseoglobus sp. 28M-23]